MNLYIYNYNNYYNRTVKKAGDSIADYESYLYYGPVQGVFGFTPGDGVNTLQLLGSSVQMYDGGGNYLIVHNPQTNAIESRWFILDNERTRNGQWQLTLHRDLIADYYAKVIEAPCFIEKATITDISNPLLFNQEQMTFNQIKKNETLLKDNSGCAWIVGYYNKNENLEGTVPINTAGSTPVKEVLTTPVTNWKYYEYTDLSIDTKDKYFNGPASEGFYMYAHQTLIFGTVKINIFNGDLQVLGGQTKKAYTSTGAQAEIVTSFKNNKSGYKKDIENAFINYGLNNLHYQSVANTHTQTETNELLSYNGATIKDSDGRYFKLNVYSQNYTKAYFITNTNDAVLYGQLLNLISPYYKDTVLISPNQAFAVEVTTTGYRISTEELTDLAVRYSLRAQNVLHTTDAAWDIFAIPYGEITVKSGSNVLVTTNASNGLTTAMKMRFDSGDKIYDMQLLPYCPIKDLITDKGEITVTSEKQYSLVSNESDEAAVGIIFNIPESRFTFDLLDYNFGSANNALDKKINNECDKWRLCSPNYSNYFDFSVEKNNGIQYINVDCDYKPYTPYIHINPNFNNLYGYDDDSPRGLILGGDFSLPYVKDAWIDYQIQNKNFQNIFDRQIQNMEVQNEMGRLQDIVGGIAGSIQSGVGGAMIGSNASGGNLGATIAGAAAGTVAGAVAGYFDAVINEKLRNEALDYTKDLFGYQLGNIQALPQTISKVSAFNKNNKIFPVLEYYTCTEIEKEALKNKIKYNGMTIMTIGKISDYIQTDLTYIKGKLIRLEDFAEDYHVANSIAGEINKGVYIN